MTPGDNDNLAHGTSPSQALLMRRPRRAKAMWLLLPATAAFCGAYIWMRAQLEPPTPVAFSTQSASSTAEHPAESPAAPTLDTASAQAAANRALSESGVPGSTDADGAARAASSDESARNLPHRTRRGSRVVNVSTNAAQRASSANALARGADGEGRSSAGRLAKPGADDEGRGASSSRELSVQAGESLHARPRQQGPRQIELEDPFRISKRRPENTRTIEREDPFR